MAKLWVVSDLHLNFNAIDLVPPAGADIAVIAGDVVDDRFLARLAGMMPTVFVAGNHEFYGHQVDERRRALAGIRDLHFLDDSSVDLSGVRFVGSTLWTGYDGGDMAAMNTARAGMNDHRLIRWSNGKLFDPIHARSMHLTSAFFLTEELRAAEFRSTPTVVVTHHAPSVRSIHPRFAGSPLNPAFYSALDDLIVTDGPEVWIHGHVHNCFSYEIGYTKVVCNPMGYPGENPEFDPGLIVEVSNG